jgi:hypothetical protein
MPLADRTGRHGLPRARAGFSPPRTRTVCSGRLTPLSRGSSGVGMGSVMYAPGPWPAPCVASSTPSPASPKEPPKPGGRAVRCGLLLLPDDLQPPPTAPARPHRACPAHQHLHHHPRGMRLAVFFTKVHHRLPGPLLDAAHSPAPPQLLQALATWDRALAGHSRHAPGHPRISHTPETLTTTTVLANLLQLHALGRQEVLRPTGHLLRSCKGRASSGY